MEFEFVRVKQSLYSTCLESVENRIHVLNANIKALKTDLQSETKSSAGDKFETGRAMLHREIMQNENQLSIANYELAFLESITDQIEAKEKASVVAVGSLIFTKTSKYFICSGLGKIELDGLKFYACSHDSPISIAMMGKKKGKSFILNDNSFTIEQIY